MGAFHLTATDIRVEDGHLLVASLQYGDDEWQESTIDLDQYIGNDEGRFVWDGENFSDSAENVHFAIEGGADVPVLRAQLPTSDGQLVDADLNLGERIDNRDGEFVFDP
ncbi:Cyanovirin-N [Aspergillus taichungensis]|uniref:Cyanovirin-N n=1 Tax=Aspergillus taichungensis TaxID=482145 RepID=A0A2J5HNF5_9EURO|nr:Cyanovirin-N [Aspergillus taichungensis]